jgi:hypothetical protein
MAPAQFATKSPASPASTPAVNDPNGESGGPELITDAAGNPILKYPVGHQHAASGCGGWLYISKDRMKFDSLTQPAHSFDLPRADLTVAQQWHFLASSMPEAEFKFRNGTTWHFFHVKRKTVENPQAVARLKWEDVLDFQALINGATRFDEVVATLQAQQKAKEPPVISMVEPAEATIEGKTLMAAGSTLRMRGIASQQSGIASVLVNGQPAMLRQLTPQTFEFTAESVAVGDGTSAVVVLAVGGDKSETHKTFTVQRRGVRMLEPSYFPYQTGEPTVRLRGVAAGYPDVQRVEINGAPATLARGDAGDMEFRAETPLQVGDNNLQGYVITGNGTREPFSLAVKRLPPSGPQPLGEKEIEKALEDGLPNTRIMALVNKYGVDFALSDDVEQRLRKAGADDALLLAIAKGKR